ncbi:MAG: asparagine synthase (glutamine-hydrolyzing) [Candidatus Omnitrophica bacterium]|nr:asparagine synthase (glutamine-hydrolyzing) [Candidatus Omnitrophota bacterium]
MCGICGNFNFNKEHIIDAEILKKMTLVMNHRGPDEFGIYKDKDIGLGHARLSIIDLSGGQQPIHNEDKSVWIVYNGEAFNYLELREELVKKGHHFYTHSDTEVLVHLYEEKGPDFVKEVNGQFAFVIWDIKKKQLMLARDRVGIRPLFYSVVDGSLLFGSEIKSIFMDKRVERTIEPKGIEQLFTFWATLPPDTVFKNVFELPPAHYMIAKSGVLTTRRYWDLDFSASEALSNRSEEAVADEFLSLLKDSIKLRLRADVPVAAYLSGGIDSSFITALVKKYFNNQLKTFSVAFCDSDFDESSFQNQMSQYLSTEHRQVRCDYSDIGRIIPDIIWHAEKPLIRTAPAPLYLLAKLVRENNIKVVLTGEGADEILAGYDLFREMKIRRFWAKFPDSKIRSELFGKLYSYLPNWPKKVNAFLKSFYRTDLSVVNDPLYSHLPKWKTTKGIKMFFSEDFKNHLSQSKGMKTILEYLPGGFSSWDHLSQAQYLEVITLLSGNLLSSQGDRMMMGHSVEGRFPFLDYRVMEFCAKLPPKLRLRVMNEKYILKKAAKAYLPENIINRTKQGYRSPDSASFFKGKEFGYVTDLLSESSLKRVNYFSPAAVLELVNKCRKFETSTISAKDNMAIVGIITTMLLEDIFINKFASKVHLNENIAVRYVS